MPISTPLPEALTFDDVLLEPGYSTVVPKDTDISVQLTDRIQMHIPVFSAAMDTVTESRLAIALAQNGGIGVIHKNMSAQRQSQEIQKVKKYESGVVLDPITIDDDATVRDLTVIKNTYAISGVPVVQKGTKTVVGIVTNRDTRFIEDADTPIASIMTKREQLVTVADRSQTTEAVELMRKHRLEKILVIDGDNQLGGLITVKDIAKATLFPDACKDRYGRLRVGGAVGPAADCMERVAQLVAASVDMLVVDTAHGHSAGVLDCVRAIRAEYPDICIIAGNIATGDAALALKDAGADIVKVGIGPGSICTTRIVAGVGIPQITAIDNVAKALQGTGVGIIADGGVRFSGDFAKAIAAGAHAVMIGSLFAGADESPGDVELYQGRAYKNYRGMGSLAAMKSGSSDRYFQEQSHHDKLVPEGIEGRVPAKGPLSGIIEQMTGGLRASMGYTGCADIKSMRTTTSFVRISNAGMKESHVHDVQIIREAPNYNL